MEPEAWRAAADVPHVEVGGSGVRAPSKVRDAQPRWLGVRASIQVAGAAGELPAYVPRDLDAELRAGLAAGAERGCFLLLVGDSSVGKTRSLYEAVRDTLPDWALVQPATAADVRRLAESPPARAVVWLDELGNYLRDGRLDGAVLDLLRAGAVLAGTLWPSDYNRWRWPAPGSDSDSASASASASSDGAHRRLLDLADVVNVPEAFSRAELRRARELAEGDPRLKIALADRAHGMTQVLAAGPELLRRWTQAANRYGRAILTAAVDARRVGAHGPLTRTLLAEAGPEYLTSAERATLPVGWLDEALDYATTPLHGAASALAPVDAGPHRIAGYVVADYLYQHVRRLRRSEPVPPGVWRVLVDRVGSGDLDSVARGAERRMEYGVVEALLRRQVAEGVKYAVTRLAALLSARGRDAEAVEVLSGHPDAAGVADALTTLLVGMGRADEAIALWRDRVATGDGVVRLADLLAEHGDRGEAIALFSGVPELGTGYSGGYAGLRLAELLAAEGRVDELAARVDAGDSVYAPPRLAALLVERGLVDRLASRAAAGDAWCARGLAKLLAVEGDVGGAVRVLRGCGDGDSAQLTAAELAEAGRVAEAVGILRAEADRGDAAAAVALAELLVEHDRAGEAIAVLRAGLGGGSSRLVRTLARLLAGQGGAAEAIEVLRVHGDPHDPWTCDDLIDLLEGRGDVDAAVEVLLAAGPGSYRGRLVAVLRKHGRSAEALALTRQFLDAGEVRVSEWVVSLLLEEGRVDEAMAVLRAHLPEEARPPGPGIVDDRLLDQSQRWRNRNRLLELLVDRGAEDELRAWAEDGAPDTADALTSLLIATGRVDEAIARLRAAAAGGHVRATARLGRVLADSGRVEEALAVLRSGAEAGRGELAEQLAALLAELGRVEELQALADDGQRNAAGWLLTDGQWVEGHLADGPWADDRRVRGPRGPQVQEPQVDGRRGDRRRGDRERVDGQWVDELVAEVRAGTAGAAERLLERLAEGDDPRAERVRVIGVSALGGVSALDG